MERTIARLRCGAAAERLIAMLLDCIADDYTGATDLASMLLKHGMRPAQHIGTPHADEVVTDADAEAVALAVRTAPVRQAVSESLTTLAWLCAVCCRQVFFKYCSTFDSTGAGNTGPVANALLAALAVGLALACPAFPLNARSVYKSYLFVGGVLLNESRMGNHPLTPMRDANLVRVLSRQTNGTVGLAPYVLVEEGGAVIRGAMTALAEQGWRYANVDAINDVHLVVAGEAAAARALITGGYDIAMGLLTTSAGAAAVLAGSCSRYAETA
jgi:uncharacterized protein YgbK (DUF1537 family)